MDTRKFKLSDQKKRSPQRRAARSWLIEHPELNPYKFTWDKFYRKITNKFRMLPDFLIIGGAKSELLHYLHIWLNTQILFQVP